jgi:hypothetical protein|tara:strand:- start:346 stop:1392 length:1047 start_codon:yes stop_codon:yes gene_type:complete
MSSMLEQAIIDAEALKEAAIKNAEHAIIEKYSQEVKKAVHLMLEQPEEDIPADPMAADPMGMDPMAAEDPAEPDPEIVQETPLAASDGENLCPCPEQGDLVTINFEQLHKQMEEEMDKEGELESGELEDREEFAAEELAGEAPMMEDVEIDDEILSALEEELEIDIKPVKSGWLETPSTEIINAEEEAEAHAAALEEVEDDKKELEEAFAKSHKMLKKLRKEKEKLTEQNNKYKQSILQMKDTINEVNIGNAKLVYTNKALSSSSLNERQKKQIVESINNASTVEEARVIYETLQSTVGSARPRRERKPQSLSEAVSRRSSTLLSNNREEKQQSNPYSDRMKKLAGIN